METETAEKSAEISVAVGDTNEVESLLTEEASVERFIDQNDSGNTPLNELRRSTREGKPKTFQDYVSYFCVDLHEDVYMKKPEVYLESNNTNEV